jgi:1-aminocyclopropane-1-carboxylate deaminase/D-cysteine desulfhydrase-like pyridoxal-dependent ACC family enzyme
MLEKSIGECGAGRSIVVDKNGAIIGGNKTRQAFVAAGMKRAIMVETTGHTPVIVKRVDLDLADPKGIARRLAYMDNRVSELDLDWDEEQIAKDLADGVDLTGLWSDKEIEAFIGGEPVVPASLADRFLVPPFTVLDGRQGYWQERKAQWMALGIDSGAGRADGLLGIDPNRKDDFGAKMARMESKAAKGLQGRKDHLVYNRGEGTDPVSSMINERGGGTSVFDPVLCELVYRWFAPAGADILDPFAGGSVRGIVAAACGHRYVGVDLRPEQITANEAQLAAITGRSGGPRQPIAAVTDPLALTPIQQAGRFFFKRDDFFRVGQATGGKVRTMLRLLEGAKGVVACGARDSTQLGRAAQVAKALGLPCRVHTASGADSSEMTAARAAGAEVIQHNPGYLTVVKKRAKEDAAAQGWTEVPWGMECTEAIAELRLQVRNIPKEVKRIVVPVGSGMTLSGVLHGMADAGLDLPVLGVMVGGEAEERIERWAPKDWKKRVKLVSSELKYEQAAPQTTLAGVDLDPIYEAKAIPFMEPGDLLWVVGIRASAADAPKRPGVSFPETAAPPRWIVGDALDIPKLVPPSATFDLLFSCPPYFDLEKYSEDPKDLSNASDYAAFRESYDRIIEQAVARLKPNRFAVFVVGEVRGKDGNYVGFVPDTIRAFERAGAHLYNEAILVTPVGTVGMRVSGHFARSRKLGKCHQNVLTFVKGDPALAASELGHIEVFVNEGNQE